MRFTGGHCSQCKCLSCALHVRSDLEPAASLHCQRRGFCGKACANLRYQRCRYVHISRRSIQRIEHLVRKGHKQLDQLSGNTVKGFRYARRSSD